MIEKLQEAAQEVQLRHGLDFITIALTSESSSHVLAEAESREFPIGSCTKAVTALLISHLVTLGRICWDLSIESALPMLSCDPFYLPKTLPDILRHEAGFPRDVPAALAQSPDIFPPNARRNISSALLLSPPVCDGYSHAGYIIAGHVVETFLRRPFEVLLTDFLHDLSILTPPPQRFDSPSTGMLLNAQEALAFLEANAGLRAVAADAIAATQTPSGAAVGGAANGMAWSILYRGWSGGMALNVTGRVDGCVTSMWLAPKRRLAFAVATGGTPETSQRGNDDAIRMIMNLFR